MDKYIGCLVGLAVGDALGSLVRRTPSGGMGGGPAPEPRGGAWLYMCGTQRALVLTESLIACGRADPEDLCRRFLRMAEGPDHLSLGCFRGPGKNFRAVISRLRTGWAWQESGADSPGIGAAVQIAPAGLALRDRDELREAVIRLSLPTHRDPRAIAAAAAVAFLVFDEVHGARASTMTPRERLARARQFTVETEKHLDEHYSTVVSLDYGPVLHQMSAMLELMEGSLSLDQGAALSRLAQGTSEFFGRPVSPTSGLSLAGVSSALWFVLAHDCRFNTAVTAAVNAGGNAGSVAAIVGVICGVIRPDTIPSCWRDGLANVDQISMRALQLAGEKIPPSLVRDAFELEQTCTERLHRERSRRRTRLRSPSPATSGSGTVFGIRFVSGRSNDPCVFFFDGNLDLCGLFDLGRTYSLRPGDVRRLNHLLISHSHIDHFIGFDHILRHSLNRPDVLHIFGPPRMSNQVQHRLRSYIWNLRRWLRLEVRVHEVSATEVTVSALSMRTAFAKRETADPVPHDGIIFDGGQFFFRAVTLQHGMPCLGYAIEEPASVRVDKERLEASGLRPGPWLKLLKDAWSAGSLAETQLEVDGKTYPAARLADDLLVPHPGRKVAYVVDTAFTDQTRERIVDLARGADLFLCEATFSHEFDLDQAHRKAHLTAVQTGQLARDAQVKRLHVFHFSRRYQNNPSILIREAKQAAEGIEVTY